MAGGSPTSSSPLFTISCILWQPALFHVSPSFDSTPTFVFLYLLHLLNATTSFTQSPSSFRSTCASHPKRFLLITTSISSISNLSLNSALVDQSYRETSHPFLTTIHYSASHILGVHTFQFQRHLLLRPNAPHSLNLARA